jgi:predicted mannosyl-3-phosphoglycerate phosphatase (HAD superfamily)
MKKLAKELIEKPLALVKGPRAKRCGANPGKAQAAQHFLAKLKRRPQSAARLIGNGPLARQHAHDSRSLV